MRRAAESEQTHTNRYMKTVLDTINNTVARLFVMIFFGVLPVVQTYAQSNCCLTLPGYPTNNISVDLSVYYPDPSTAYSLFTVKVLVGPIPLAPPAPLYAGWCVDANTDINVTQQGQFTNYMGYLYSTCDTNLNTELGPDHPASVYVSPATWKKVNYVLNHRDFTKPPYSGPVAGYSFAYFWDVQEVINAYVGGPIPQHYFPVHPAVSNALYTAAETNAASWQPQCGVDTIAAVANFDPTPFTFPPDDLQLIIIEVPFCPPIECPTNVMVECGDSLDPTQNNRLGFPTTDPCCTVQSSYSDTTSSSNCPGSFVVTRTWKATNAWGITATCVQTITVVDTTPPVIVCPTNITLECTVAPTTNNTGVATATDTCSGITNLVFGDSFGATNCTGKASILRTWTATDGCGNSASCLQTISFKDTTAPIITCASNKTVQCGTAWDFDAPTATDNCGGASISVSGTVTNTQPGNSFTVTRCWLATDQCGNTNGCCQTVTVITECAPLSACTAPYPFQSTNVLTSVVFNESEVLRAFTV